MNRSTLCMPGSQGHRVQKSAPYWPHVTSFHVYSMWRYYTCVTSVGFEDSKCSIRRLLQTSLRMSSFQNIGLFNMSVAMLAIHQDRRWFMGMVHLKGHARPRARRLGAPPRGGGIPKLAALGLLPRPTEVQPRAYTCMYMYMHAHGHMHGQAYGRWKGPRSPGSRRRRAGGSRNETGLGRRPGSSSGYWFWNWVKQKKSPVGHTSTCTCTCLLLLPCRLRVGSFRVNEGSCFSLVETSHGTQVHGNGASDGLCSQ